MGLLHRRKRLDAGATAPDFSLPALDGGNVSLSSAGGGKPVLLVFFKVSCPTCQFALPFLERLHRSQPAAQVFTVSQNGPADTREFNEHYGLTMPSLLDPEEGGYKVSNAYGLTHVPSLFLVEPDGRISFASDGFSRPELEALGRRFGVAIFRPGENVPAWKAG
jgi:peroxiredoxin